MSIRCIGVVQSTFNVADATIQGVELDVVAQVTDHLVLTAGYGYTDASYDSAVAGFNTNLDFVRVPEQTFAGSATYTFDLDQIGQLSLRGGVSYTDKEFFNDANTVSGPAYTLVDASIDYVSLNHQVEGVVVRQEPDRGRVFLLGFDAGCAGRQPVHRRAADLRLADWLRLLVHRL